MVSALAIEITEESMWRKCLDAEPLEIDGRNCLIKIPVKLYNAEHSLQHILNVPVGHILRW